MRAMLRVVTVAVSAWAWVAMAGDLLPASESLTTRAVRLKEIRLGDGSVVPGGEYSLKIRGLGKTDVVEITLIDSRARQIKVLKGVLRRTAPSQPRTWGDPHAPATLAGLGFTAGSEVRLLTRGSTAVLAIAGKGAVIEAEVTAAGR